MTPALDVAILRYCYVRMSQDCLDRFIGHSQVMQVRCKPTPKSVPAVPLGTPRNSLVLVLLFSVLVWQLVTVSTSVEHGKNLPVQNVVKD